MYTNILNIIDKKIRTLFTKFLTINVHTQQPRIFVQYLEVFGRLIHNGCPDHEAFSVIMMPFPGTEKMVSGTNLYPMTVHQKSLDRP